MDKTVKQEAAQLIIVILLLILVHRDARIWR